MAECLSFDFLCKQKWLVIILRFIIIVEFIGFLKGDENEAHRYNFKP